MQPFRFLANGRAIVTGGQLAEKARRAESMGYSALVIPDHMIEQFSPVPALATIAAATERLRIGSYVFNNDLRHPAVLAQDLASLDVLSGGRLDIGMGAGWNRPEYDAIGITFDAPAVRAARLEESVAVLKGLFGDGPLVFHGAHYSIEGREGFPKPLQRPHPPFLIGGGGRRTLSLAGREANVVGLAPRITPSGDDPRSITVEATAEKMAWVRAAAGDRFPDLEFNVYPMTGVVVTDRPRAVATELADRLQRRSGFAVTANELLESPNVFVNSIDGFVAKFRELRERFGINSIMVEGMDELAPVVERLAGT